MLLSTLFVVSCASKPKADLTEPPPPEIKKSDKKAESRPVETKPEARAEVAETAPREVKHDALNAALISGSEERIRAASVEILQNNPKDTKALNSLAMNAFKKGQVDAAVLILEKILTIDTRSSSAHANLGLIHLNRGEKREAIEMFKKALEYDSDNFVAAMNLGSIYIKEKDYNKALVALDRAVDKGKADENSMNNYAVALVGTGKSQQAADIYEKILKNNSSNKNAMLNLAIVLIEKLNKFEDGLDLVNRLKFVGADFESRQVIKDLENKAKAGLK